MGQPPCKLYLDLVRDGTILPAYEDGGSYPDKGYR